MKDDIKDIIELSDATIEEMIYEIRGQKVMLDFDLARIYGYSTKAFNQQVKNNNEKFPDEFMFQISNSEALIILRSKNLTSKELSSKRRYNPYAFTEQGIYMLMTVLKGELATKQSIALIKAFKQMKDYLLESNNLNSFNELTKLVSKVEKHDTAIIEMRTHLKRVMDNFINPNTYKHFLFLNGEKLEADITYQQIYSFASKTIILIDDYIDVKTLQLLKSSREFVELTIFSDNKAKNQLTKQYISDFEEETNSKISIYKNNNRFHDRYIIIDYLSDNEMIYLCGSSSKDAGNKITTIMKIEKNKVYHDLIDEMLINKEVLEIND